MNKDQHQNIYESESADKTVDDLFGGRLSLEQALQKLRTRLLDLSSRNRLLNYKHPKGRSIQFVDNPNLKELSEFLKVKPSTIYSWVHNGTIPFIKLNGLLRFDMDEVQEWVRSSSKHLEVPKSFKKPSSLDVDAIVKRAVASVRPRSYDHPKRETSLNQGLRKED